MTIEDKLNKFVKDCVEYRRKEKEASEAIDRNARILLSELQKIDGWECLIKSCEGHYEKYPDEFFEWCSVTHTDDAVQFVKGYSDGDEFEVLEISFKKPLKQQVQERLEILEDAARKKETDEREKDLMELERLRKKYKI